MPGACCRAPGRQAKKLSSEVCEASEFVTPYLHHTFGMFLAMSSSANCYLLFDLQPFSADVHLIWHLLTPTTSSTSLLCKQLFGFKRLLRASRGKAHIFPTIYLPHIRFVPQFGMSFVPFSVLTQHNPPSMRFVSLRPVVCLKLPSDPSLAGSLFSLISELADKLLQFVSGFFWHPCS